MAFTDIVYPSGDKQAVILEITATAYTGQLADINTEANSSASAVVEEPKVSTVQIADSRRKVR